MKKILLITALFCVSLATDMYAQCTPDPTVIALGAPGLFPDPATGIDTGLIGTAYAQTLTMIVPADTTVAFPPAPPTTVTINTATVTGVAGLPAGLAYSCSPAGCVYPGGSNGCLIMNGTPTVAGTFTVTVTVVINVNAPIVGPTDLPAQDIVYTLEVTDTATGGCAVTVATTSVDESVAGANDGTATATPAGGTTPYTYLWSDLQSTSTATGLAPGTYTVDITDAAACTATGSVTIMDGVTSVPRFNKTAFGVFTVTPNPSIDFAEIRFSAPDNREVSVSVYNMIGAIVVEELVYSELGMNIVSLNSAALDPGVYFITLRDGEQTSTKRMVVGSR